MAIDRKDAFIMESFKMIPGHVSLVRPYYYVAGTGNLYWCKHLGWRVPNRTQSKDKIICFTRYAGHIDPVILPSVAKSMVLYHTFFKYIYKIKWTLLAMFFWMSIYSKGFQGG